MQKGGRSFNCDTCPQSIQKLRRCKEDRWDFTSEDGPLWPMYVSSADGELYGFCPAKSTWDSKLVDSYHELCLISELKVLPKAGGLDEQDGDLIEQLSWFLQKYDMVKYMRKVEMVMGSDDKNAKALRGSQPMPRKK